MQNNDYLNNQELTSEMDPVDDAAAAQEPIPEDPRETSADPSQDTDAPTEPGQDSVPPSEPQHAESKPAKKKILTIVVAVIASVALLTALVFGAVAMIRAQNPLNLVSDAFANTMNAMLKEPEATLNGGSVEVSVDLATFMESFVGYASIDGDASLKFYADDTPASAVVASLKMAGADVLDLTAVFDEERLAVASDVLFGNDVYGISYDSFSEKFDDSVFGMNGAYSLGIDAEDIAEIFGSMPVSEEFSEDAAKVFANFLIELKKSADEHVTVEKVNETISFAGTDCNTTAVSVSIDTLGLYNILHDMMVYVNEDKEIRAFVEENSVALAAFLSEMLYEEINSSTFADEFYELIGECLDQMEAAKEDGTVEETEIDIKVTFYVSKKGTYLVGALLDGAIDGEELKIEIYAGPTPAEMTEISLRVDDGYTTLKAVFEVLENSKDAYEASFYLRDDGVTYLSYDLQWDKNEGDFALTLSLDGGTALLTGDLVRDKEGAVLTLDKFAIEGEEYDLGVTVTTKCSDKMPEITEYTDLLDMSEDDVEDILFEIVAEAMKLFG